MRLHLQSPQVRQRESAVGWKTGLELYTYSSSRHLCRPGVKICAVLWTKTFLKSLPTLGRPFTNMDIKFITSIICDKQQDQAAFLFHFLNISTVFQSSADAVLVQICFPLVDQTWTLSAWPLEYKLNILLKLYFYGYRKKPCHIQVTIYGHNRPFLPL